MEKGFKSVPFPDENINLNLENYAKIICNLMDIPIHKLNTNRSVIEALHVLFSTYYEFMTNKHFPNQKANKFEENVQSMKFNN